MPVVSVMTVMVSTFFTSMSSSTLRMHATKRVEVFAGKGQPRMSAVCPESIHRHAECFLDAIVVNNTTTTAGHAAQLYHT
jgi:hypothetical protein